MESGIRFFENRFKSESALVSMLKLELDRKHQDTKRLQDTLINLVSPKEEIDSEPLEAPQPIAGTAQHWRVRARQLEEKSREEAKKIRQARREARTAEDFTVRATNDDPNSDTIEELEAELGINQG